MQGFVHATKADDNTKVVTQAWPMVNSLVHFSYL